MKILHAFVLCSCFIACTNRNSVPSDIIQPDSMKPILRDVIMADQYATQYLLKDSLKRDSIHRNVKLETLQLYETIFKLHGVTKEKFRKSLDFYASRPDLSKNMLDSMSAYENLHRNDLFQPKAALMLHPGDSLTMRRRDSLTRRMDSVRRRTDSLRRRTDPVKAI